MDHSLRRRGPYVVEPPRNNATPVRFIPRVKVLLRQPVIKATLLAGVVFYARPVHATVPAPVKVPSNEVVLRQNFEYPGSVVRVAPVKPIFDPKVKKLLPIKLVDGSHPRYTGQVTRVVPVRVNINHYSKRLLPVTVVVGPRYYNRGQIVRTRPILPAVISSKRVVPVLFVPRQNFKYVGSVVIENAVNPTFDPKSKRIIPVRFVPRQNFKYRGTWRYSKPILSSSPYTVCQYAGHFIINGWNSPQDQVNAGYPIYIQPTQLNGYYEEIIDYGTTLTNNIVSITYSENVIVAGVTITVKISTSTDGISYSAFASGPSLFATILRYVKFRLEFTSADAHALTQVSNIQTRLDVKREVDSGTANAVATDVGGTVVTFNKAFKDIDSITVTANSTVPVTCIYDFLDIPNPVSFKVFALDTTGNRVDALVTWKARGIV